MPVKESATNSVLADGPSRGRAVVAIASTNVITSAFRQALETPCGTTEDCCGVLTCVGNSDGVNLCVIM
jgi:hypothetical protein